MPNLLNKFTVSLRDKPTSNPDGSLTLYVQKQSAGNDKQANGVPTPKGALLPMSQMYGPGNTTPSILQSHWTPPEIAQVT